MRSIFARLMLQKKYILLILRVNIRDFSCKVRKGVRMGKENREVKSSVLVDLMYEDESAEENERSFYNALHEEQLPNNIEIKKLRVENVVYMNFKNDFHSKQEIRF